MRRINLYPLLILLVIVGLHIQSCKKDAAVEDPPYFCNVDCASLEPVYEMAGSVPTWPDPFTIDTLYLKGDTLHLQLHYAGGCEEHCTRLQWFGQIDTSTNYTHFDIGHCANGDLCQALIFEKVKFDIGFLKSYVDSINIAVLAKAETYTFLYK